MCRLNRNFYLAKFIYYELAGDWSDLQPGVNQCPPIELMHMENWRFESNSRELLVP